MFNLSAGKLDFIEIEAPFCDLEDSEKSSIELSRTCELSVFIICCVRDE